MLAASSLAFAQSGPNGARIATPSIAPGTETEQLVEHFDDERFAFADAVAEQTQFALQLPRLPVPLRTDSVPM